MSRRVVPTFLTVAFALVALGCPELRDLREENARLRREQAQASQRAAYAERVSATTTRERTEIELSYEEEFERRDEENKKLLDEAQERETALQEEGAELREQIEGIEKKLADTEAAKEQTSNELAAKSAEYDKLQQEHNKLLESKKAIETALDESKKSLKAAQAEIEAQKAGAEATRKASAAAEALQAKLREISASGAISVSSVQPGSDPMLTIPISELFDSGVVELNDHGRSLLTELAAELKKLNFARLVVAGHADNQPIETLPFYNNTELSFRRAFAVSRCLTEEGGLTNSKVAVAAYGEHRPVASNSTREGREKNRRVEIRFIVE